MNFDSCLCPLSVFVSVSPGTGFRHKPACEVSPGLRHHGPFNHSGQRQHNRALAASLPGSAQGRGKGNARFWPFTFMFGPSRKRRCTSQMNLSFFYQVSLTFIDIVSITAKTRQIHLVETNRYIWLPLHFRRMMICVVDVQTDPTIKTTRCILREVWWKAWSGAAPRGHARSVQLYGQLETETYTICWAYTIFLGWNLFVFVEVFQIVFPLSGTSKCAVRDSGVDVAQHLLFHNRQAVICHLKIRQLAH